MEKPVAIASRGIRKETLEQVAKGCNGNLVGICHFLHCDIDMARALLMSHRLYPIVRDNGDIVFTDPDETLFQLAKEEAGYGNRKLPKLDDCFSVRWSPEAWAKIVAKGEEIIKRTGSIYPPWKEIDSIGSTNHNTR